MCKRKTKRFEIITSIIFGTGCITGTGSASISNKLFAVGPVVCVIVVVELLFQRSSSRIDD
jgi:hypothetical protein